ncbi:MAG: outer membrane beta-barrel protein [Chitinophagales bacterium]|nr:outer membrane beta-barrel protein [Chitinophagales bacterium]MDW8428559.1 outer membrane beta-barrel protein [Chitinophagales bacterium]
MVEQRLQPRNRPIRYLWLTALFTLWHLPLANDWSVQRYSRMQLPAIRIEEAITYESVQQPAFSTLSLAKLRKNYWSEKEAEALPRRPDETGELAAIVLEKISLSTISHPLMHKTIRNEWSIADECNRRWQVGFLVQLNNNWLVDFKNVFKDDVRYQFTMGASYGLTAGYSISSRWALFGGLVHTLGAGQRFANTAVHGRAVDLQFTAKQISLSYLHVPLWMQYELRPSAVRFDRNMRLNLFTGLQYGRLLHFTMDKLKGDMKNNFVLRNNEYSLVGGVAWQLFERDGSLYTVGLRGAVSTPIFTRQMEQYYELQRARNVSLGLFAAISLNRCASRNR